MRAASAVVEERKLARIVAIAVVANRLELMQQVQHVSLCCALLRSVMEDRPAQHGAKGLHHLLLFLRTLRQAYGCEEGRGDWLAQGVQARAGRAVSCTEFPIVFVQEVAIVLQLTHDD